MTEPIKQRLDRVAARSVPKRCAVPGCLHDARRFGSMCGKHDQRVRHVGHPSASEISAQMLKPWAATALTFVHSQKSAGHTGFIAACAWLHGLMQGAVATGDLHRHTSPAIRWQHWLVKFRVDGVTPEQIIATGIACHLHRLNFPHLWPSDRHFAHQFGKHIIGISSRRHCVTKSGRLSSRPLRKPSGVMLLASGEIHNAIGVLLMRASQHLKDEMDKPIETRKVPGQHEAFAGTSRT